MNTRSKPPRLSSANRSALAVAAVAALAFASTAANAAANLAGVWVPLNPPKQLRTLGGRPLPLTTEAAGVYAQNRAALASGKKDADPASRCLPPGTIRLMTEPMPFEIVQDPKQVTLVFQYNGLVRRVLLGRPHPADLEVLPYLGHSIGKWDGDVLVVDTVSLNPDAFLDASGLPHSEDLRLTERLKLAEHGKVLVDRITIDDPMTFTRPWTTELRFVRRPGLKLKEDVCLDREHRMTTLD